MLAKRIIPCLDVKNGKVVKGIKFKNHEIVGDIIELAKKYNDSGADELVFYDITASSDDRTVNKKWIYEVAKVLNIPFSVAGGIKTVKQAEEVLNYGADKISINSPAINNPCLIDEMVKVFGSQCIVIGIDSFEKENKYNVFKYTGSENKSTNTNLNTLSWVKEVGNRGAGEIVLNCMNMDGVRTGYDIKQLKLIKSAVNIPVVASGGAGEMIHFKDVFNKSCVDGALAASVFHKGIFSINELKTFLKKEKIEVRL